MSNTNRIIELWYDLKGNRVYETLRSLREAQKRYRHLHKCNTTGLIIDVRYRDNRGEVIEDRMDSYHLVNGKFKKI